MARLVEAIRQFAPRLTGPGVVAVSGGADSVALLRGLREVGIGPLTVAHFDHRLRAESGRDAQFVEKLAGGLGLPFRLGSADVASEGGNLEATARRLRYAWLAQVASEVGAKWVATGHTADDQAETVLHRLIRGTGLRGLRGIAESRLLNPTPGSSRQRGGEEDKDSVASSLAPPPRCREGVGGWGFPLLVRPLLTVTRADVLAYLEAIGEPHREDASNADPRFTRNRIRRELLPLLKTFNPEIVAVLNRLAEQATEETQLRDARIAELLAAAELPRAGGMLVFDADRLAAESDAMLGDLFLRIWEREGWSRNAMTFAHWRRLAGIVRGDPAADFPDGIHIRRVGRVVQIGRRA